VGGRELAEAVMAKRDKREAGKSFVESMLALLPENERANVQTILMRDALLDFAGEQHLRHDEFSRMSDELRKQTETVRKQGDANLAYRTELDTWKNDLSTWASGKKAEFDKVNTARAAGDLLPDQVDLSGYMKADDVRQLVDAAVRDTQEQGVSLIALTPQLSMRHYIEFKEPLNLFEVVKHARESGLRLDLAYEDYIKPRMEERRQKELDERIKAAREEGALEERKRQFTQPYPISTSEPSTLDGLKADFKKQNPVEAAVADYYAAQRPV
jgi:hypothetical protein